MVLIKKENIPTQMFYISCRGSGATHWIAKNLSKHRKIVCFYSSRSFPPMWPGDAVNSTNSWVRENLPVENYIESLEVCSRATHGEKFFGAVHGYHGLEAKEACEKRDGIFRYIIRNPLEQIHSAFIAYCDISYFSKFKKNIKNQDIHEYVCELLKDEITSKKFLEKKHNKKNFKNKLISRIKKTQSGTYAIEYLKKLYQNPTLLKLRNNKRLNKYSKVSSVNEEKKILTQLFIDLLNDFFITNTELFFNCPSNYGFKMENLTESKEYFGNFVKVIAPGVKINEDYLNFVFLDNKRFNTHRDKKIYSNEIWGTLPNSLKEYYSYFFYKYKINKICDNFNYDYSFL